MPKSRKKSGKRKSLEEMSMIGKCTSPEISSPESDGTVQSKQVNSDVAVKRKEVQSTIDIGEISTDKRYSDEYITNTSQYDEELAEQNRNEADGYFTNTPEYDTGLAEQNRNEADGYVTKILEQRILDEKNKHNSDEFTKKSSNIRALDFDQRRCRTDEIGITSCKKDDTISIGGYSLLEKDEQIDTTSNKKEDTTSIGACALSNKDEQLDTSSDEKEDNISIGTGSKSVVDEKMDNTTDKRDETLPIGACSLSNRDEQIDATTNKKDDTPSNVPKDTDGQMGLNTTIVDDDLENSNGSVKQKDVKVISTSLYIDPMVMDSQREILLNMKSLIEQNVKQIKEMRKRKAQINLSLLKEELRHERSEKDVKEMKGRITTLREEFWDEAKKFPSAVSLKTDKHGVVKVKNKQDLVDHLNTMKRKEKLLKEVIPKLEKENALKRTWSPTVPAITFSPVIQQLNQQFLIEFGTRFEFKLLKPGIYFRDPFSRTTYHVAVEKIEDFKINHPYWYHNCQRFIKGKDIENFTQQIGEDNERNEMNQGFRETKEKDVEKQISETENNEIETNKRKVMALGTGLEMNNDDKNLENGPDTMMFNGNASRKTQIGCSKENKETSKKHELKKEDAIGIAPFKSQTIMAQNIKKPIVQSKIDDGKSVTKRKVTSKIPKASSSHGKKMKINTDRCSQEMTVNNKNKENNEQKITKVDRKILERVEQMRELGKDVFVKTTGDKSFIYIKPAAKGTETGNDAINRKNRLSSTMVSKGNNPVIDQMTVCRPPPVSRTHYEAMHSVLTTNKSTENMSLWDNTQFIDYAKPVVVVGKTKIPLFIRNNLANMATSPRRKPNASVLSPLTKLEERQSNHSVMERNDYPSRSDPRSTDALNNEVITGRDLFTVNKDISVSMENQNEGGFITSPTRTFIGRPKLSRKSLIPISVRYIKEKGQNNEVEKETMPYIPRLLKHLSHQKQGKMMYLIIQKAVRISIQIIAMTLLP